MVEQSVCSKNPWERHPRKTGEGWLVKGVVCEGGLFGYFGGPLFGHLSEEKSNIQQFVGIGLFWGGVGAEELQVESEFQNNWFPLRHFVLRYSGGGVFAGSIEVVGVV